MRKFLVLPLLALVACDDPCEQLAETVDARYRQCDPDYEPEPDTGDPSESECDEQDAELADCLQPCYKQASCEALLGTDLGEAMDFVQCMAECGQQ